MPLTPPTTLEPTRSSMPTGTGSARSRSDRFALLPTLVTPFASDLLQHDFCDLDRRVRDETVAFIVRRLEIIPSIARLGVIVIAAVVRLLMLALPLRVCLGLVTRVPLASEYVRLLRSLAFARIWETEPSTGPTGRTTVTHVH